MSVILSSENEDSVIIATPNGRLTDSISRVTRRTDTSNRQFQEKIPPIVQTPGRSSLTTVHIKVAYITVGEIDTVKEQYNADVYVQARWRENALKGKVASNVNFDKLWNPQIVLQNLVSHSKYKEWREIREGKDGTYVVERRRIKGVFSEHLELYDFPFDSQHLGIIITSELSCAAIDLRLDAEELSTVEVGSFVDEQEWKLRFFTHSHFRKIRKDFREDTNTEYPLLTVVCEAERRPGFYVWNIMLIMTIIVLLSFGTFAVSHDKVQNRLQLGFTLTLTGVAFRFVTNQSLPKIPYLTQLDKYILFSMVFNFLICVWHVIVSRFIRPGQRDACDLYAVVGFIALYILFLLCFTIIAVVKWTLHHQKLKTYERSYQLKASKMQSRTWKQRNGSTSNSKIFPVL